MLKNRVSPRSSKTSWIAQLDDDQRAAPGFEPAADVREKPDPLAGDVVESAAVKDQAGESALQGPEQSFPNARCIVAVDVSRQVEDEALRVGIDALGADGKIFILRFLRETRNDHALPDGLAHRLVQLIEPLEYPFCRTFVAGSQDIGEFRHLQPSITVLDELEPTLDLSDLPQQGLIETLAPRSALADPDLVFQ